MVRRTRVRAVPPHTVSGGLELGLGPVPVTDVERAKAFYVEQGGFHADHDHQVHEALRFVQLAPIVSGCSIVLDTGVTKMTPGSQQGLQLVVSDMQAARSELAERGVDVIEVQQLPGSYSSSTTLRQRLVSAGPVNGVTEPPRAGCELRAAGSMARRHVIP